MSQQARITSVEVLETFRASLITFLSKARNALDQVGDETLRTRSWLQQEQRLHWEREVRRRQKVLQQAEQELLSARMIKLLENLSARQAAVHKARHALDEAEGKLRNVKMWNRDFDGTVEPLTRALENLRAYLAHDLPKGIAYLMEAQKILEGYNEIQAAPRDWSRMNTGGIDQNLAQAAKNLAAEWQQTKAYWRDEKSREFEEKYLEALPQQVVRATAAIAEINTLLRRIRHDCE